MWKSRVLAAFSGSCQTTAVAETWGGVAVLGGLPTPAPWAVS